MSKEWFVLDDRGRMGPFTKAQLIETLAQHCLPMPEVAIPRQLFQESLRLHCRAAAEAAARTSMRLGDWGLP
jgi:hypothetical protein